MRNYEYVYRLAGVRVSHATYRRFGRYLPQWLRSVKSVPS